MRHSARAGVATLAVVLAACAGSQTAAPDTALAERLAGIWSATLQLDRPLPFRDGVSTTELHGRVAIVGGDARRVSTSDVLAYGAYAIDFSPAGFRPRSSAGAHDAVVRRLGDDSIE